MKRVDSGKYLYHSKEELGGKQQTEYQEEMLCSNCEGLIGKTERHVGGLAWAWMNSRPGKRPNQECRRYDYSLFKRFVIATVWRMSVATSSYFRHFVLPSELEETLRLHILRQDTAEDFPLIAYLDGSNVSKGGFTSPTLGPDSDGRVFVAFVCFGFIWHLYFPGTNLGLLASGVLSSEKGFVYSIFNFVGHPAFEQWSSRLNNEEFQKVAKLPRVSERNIPEPKGLTMLGLPQKPLQGAKFLQTDENGTVVLLLLLYRSNGLPGQLKAFYYVGVTDFITSELIPHETAMSRFDLFRDWPERLHIDLRSLHESGTGLDPKETISRLGIINF